MSFNRQGMLLAGGLALVLGGIALCPPASAQDVLVLPKPDKGTAAEDTKPAPAPNNSWLNLPIATPTPQKPGKEEKGATPAPPPQKPVQKPVQKPADPKKPATPFVVPPTKGKPGEKQRQTDTGAEFPPEVKAAISQAQTTINLEIEKLRTQPTQVFAQPDFAIAAGKDERVFENRLEVRFGEINITESDLKKIAAGTELEPGDILKTCEKRITGSVVTNEGAELIELRGNGTSSTGYKGKIQSVNAVLALACNLHTVPKDKGIVVKFGEYYNFGLANGLCPPPEGGRAQSVSFDYVGNGVGVKCVYK